MTKERYNELKEAVLRELTHTPQDYMLPDEHLRAGLRLALKEEPSLAEINHILHTLEFDGIIKQIRSRRRGISLWAITDEGQLHAEDMNIY